MKLDFTAQHLLRLKQIPVVRCKAKVGVDPSQRGRNKKKGDACNNHASIYINGSPYCLRHAQVVALDILVREKIATIGKKP